MSLVIDDRTRAHWEKAQTKPEWGATKFWEYVLKEQFFTGRDWSLSSQQPPTDESSDLRRMELRIEKWIGNQWYTIICYEAKKAKCTQTEIDELECQAYNACITHLNYTGRDQMYAITTIGTAARLWYITKTDDYLLPFVPVDTALAERSAYIEAHSTDAQQLRDGFNYVKENDKVSSKRLKVLRSDCSPRTFAAFMGEETRSSTLGTPGMPAVQLTYGSNQKSMESIDSIASKQPYSYGPSPISSANPVTQPRSADTSMAETAEAEDEEMDDDDSEPVAAINADTPYVEATRKVVSHMLRDDEVFYCFGGRETTKNSWKRSTILYGGKVMPCMLYTSSKGSKYWTWSLPKGKGKGKA